MTMHNLAVTAQKPEPVLEAGPTAVHVDAGDVTVVVAPPAQAGMDRKLFSLINGLPHSPTSDRYVSVLSGLGEGLGWVARRSGAAMLGGPKVSGPASPPPSRRWPLTVQQQIKPRFRRVRPFVKSEARVVGIRPVDHSFPSGHTASSFAAATALAFFYPGAAPLAYALATAVGVSRVHLGVHFPIERR